MRISAGMVHASVLLACVCGATFAQRVDAVAEAQHPTEVVQPRLSDQQETMESKYPDDFRLTIREFSQSVTDDPRPRLIIVCEAPIDDRYITFIGLNNERALVAAITSARLHNASQDILLSPIYEMVGVVPNPRASDPRSDTATMDWAYIFDRNGDGRIDYLAYLESALPVLPEDYEGEIPDVSDETLTKHELQLLLRSTKMVFWHMQDANFDGEHDVFFVPMTNDKLGGIWIDSWLLAQDQDFDGTYDQCSYFVRSLRGESADCVSDDAKYRVPGRSFAGLEEVPLPASVDLFARINESAAYCALDQSAFYSDTDGIFRDLEVTPIETEERDRIYYVKGSDSLATGVETIYSREEPTILVVTYKDGLKDGLETGWSNNEQKLFESNFVAGKRQGIHVTWYANGMKNKATHYKDDVEQGIQKRWYGPFKGGVLMAESVFVNGKREGSATAWHPNGKKMMEINFKDGQRDGLATHWYDNGKKEWQGMYANGEPTGEFNFWNKRGRVKRMPADEYPEESDFFPFDDIWP